MIEVQRLAVRDVAVVLAKVCGDQIIADLMNATLCVQEEPRLSDAEADIGSALFDALTDLRPDCIDIATGVAAQSQR